MFPIGQHWVRLRCTSPDVGNHFSARVPNKRLLQFYGPGSGDGEEGQNRSEKEGLGIEKY